MKFVTFNGTIFSSTLKNFRELCMFGRKSPFQPIEVEYEGNDHSEVSFMILSIYFYLFEICDIHYKPI